MDESDGSQSTIPLEPATSPAGTSPFFRLAPDLMCIVDLAGVLLEANDAFESILGYAPRELIGTPLFSLVHPDDLERTLQAAYEALESGQVARFENRYVHRDGAVRWISWHARIDHARQVTYATGRDVTENRLQALRLRAAAAVMSAVTGGADQADLIGVVLREGLAVSGARAGALLLPTADGVRLVVHDTVGEDPAGAQWADGQTRAFTSAARAYGTGEPVFVGTDEPGGRHPTPDAPHSVAALPLTADDERLGVLLFTFTGEHHFEEQERQLLTGFTGLAAVAIQRARVDANLRSSARHLRLALQAGRLGTWSVGEDGTITADEEARCMLDLHLPNPLPHAAFEERVHPADRGRIRDEFDAAVSDDGQLHLEFRTNDPEGQERWLETWGSVRSGAGGGRTMTLGVIADVTRRKRSELRYERQNMELEALVEQRTRRLQEVNRELEAFAYSVSHDLQAPVRHVMGFTQLLQREVPAPSERATQFMQRILEASGRMTEMIEALLQYSRHGGEEVRMRTVDLRALVHEVIRDLNPDTENREVIWNVRDLPDVLGDLALLRVVFTNLLGNALKYTRERAPAVIEVYTQPGPDVTVVVQDNGVGFHPREAERVFGLFHRAHTQAYEGTGVGLATVRRIIQRHGGRTWAEGNEGGATLYVTLPAAPRD